MIVLLVVLLLCVVPAVVVMRYVDARVAKAEEALSEPAVPTRRRLAAPPRGSVFVASIARDDHGPRVNRFGELED